MILCIGPGGAGKSTFDQKLSETDNGHLCPAYAAVLIEMSGACAVCGDVACERDLLWVVDADASMLDVADGDLVCRDCGR